MSGFVWAAIEIRSTGVCVTEDVCVCVRVYRGQFSRRVADSFTKTP